MSGTGGTPHNYGMYDTAEAKFWVQRCAREASVRGQEGGRTSLYPEAAKHTRALRAERLTGAHTHTHHHPTAAPH